jgi:thiamine biosynthesis lipoprotein
MAAERRFAAMGSDAHVVVVGPDGQTAFDLAIRASARIEELEARWSRFRPDSEVSRLNAARGAPVTVSSDTVHLVAMAVEAWRHSGGFVDCTLLEQVVAAGYDRPLIELPPDRAADPRWAPVPPALLGPLDLEVTPTTVRLPAELGFDPGGIGKGLAADIVVAELIADGAQGACVNLGGDVRVHGSAPDGGPWTVSIDHPARPVPLALVGLVDGAVATSTTLRRRWAVDGEERHHLIDPRTGASSTSDLVFVSVVAASAWEAEVLAKAVLLRGGPHPFDLIEGTEAHALAVDHGGRVTATPGLAAHLGDRPLPDRVDWPVLEAAS